MSTTQNINGIIQQYQSQKASCETELARVNTEIAVSDNNIKQLMATAQEQFGTTDINMLNTILVNLTNEFDTLTNELNSLSVAPQVGA